jgi:hypothetical protein
MLNAKLPRFADEAYIFTGTVGLHTAQKSLETVVDGF